MQTEAIGYKRHRFPPQIIAHVVWLYVRYSLSLSEVEELLLERGVDVSYWAILRWTFKFGPLIAPVFSFDLYHWSTGYRIAMFREANAWASTPHDKLRKRQMYDFIGVDMSTDTLDVYLLVDGQHKQFSNRKRRFADLFKWVGLHSTPLIIFEANGAYHRQLDQALGIKGRRFVKVNAKLARGFAQASGKLAKPDRVPSRAC